MLITSIGAFIILVASLFIAWPLFAPASNATAARTTTAMPGKKAVAVLEAQRDQALAALTATNPQNRLVQPEEVARVVAWLCLPSTQAITGQAIPVAGGEVMS